MFDGTVFNGAAVGGTAVGEARSGALECHRWIFSALTNPEFIRHVNQVILGIAQSQTATCLKILLLLESF